MNLQQIANDLMVLAAKKAEFIRNQIDKIIDIRMKEGAKICGIYEIRNVANDKFYVGSSCDVKKRWQFHKSMLKNNRYIIIEKTHLQRAYNLYGQNNFKYHLLEECYNQDIQLQREQYFLDNLKPWDKKIGYNDARDASAPMKGRKQTQETIAKRSAKMLGHQTSLDTRIKIKSSLLGHKISKTTRIKISLSRKGKRAGEYHPLFGIKGNLAPNYGNPSNYHPQKETIAAMKATKKIKKYGSLDNYNNIVSFIKSTYIGRTGPTLQTIANMIFEKFGIRIAHTTVCKIANSM